jgi:hypothetical protein
LNQWLGEERRNNAAIQSSIQDELADKLEPLQRKAGKLEKRLERALRVLDKHAQRYEIYVVDDPTGTLPEECGTYRDAIILLCHHPPSRIQLFSLAHLFLYSPTPLPPASQPPKNYWSRQQG